MLRSPNQTANQIRRSYKNDQSNIFLTVGNDVSANTDFQPDLTNAQGFFVSACEQTIKNIKLVN